MSSICIIGLGWLGFPLAKTLQTKNHCITGTVRSLHKTHLISKALNVIVEHFDLYANSPVNTNNLHNSLNNAEVVIINVPPGRKNFRAELYIENMQKLIKQAFAASCEQLIFVSTTGVFSNSNTIVTNTTVADAETPSGAAHIEIENHLLTHYANATTIIRPAGLVGPNHKLSNITPDPTALKVRHPIYTLCHKTGLERAYDPVNLVHLDDVISVICAVIEQRCVSQTLNVSASQHPTRGEYYKWCAQQLNLPIPGFLKDNKKRQVGKTIDASDTFSLLNLSPSFDSPYDML